MTNRTFQVRIDNQKLIIRKIRAEVPQESILAPILCNLYSADTRMPRLAHFQIILYADNTVLYTNLINIDLAIKKQQEILEKLTICIKFDIYCA